MAKTVLGMVWQLFLLLQFSRKALVWSGKRKKARKPKNSSACSSNFELDSSFFANYLCGRGQIPLYLFAHKFSRPSPPPLSLLIYGGKRGFFPFQVFQEANEISRRRRRRGKGGFSKLNLTATSQYKKSP